MTGQGGKASKGGHGERGGGGTDFQFQMPASGTPSRCMTFYYSVYLIY
jgi:hypothetical protein